MKDSILGGLRDKLVFQGYSRGGQSGRRPSFAKGGIGRRILGRQRVTEHTLQDIEVLAEAIAAVVGDADERLWSVSLVTFPHLDQSRLLQDRQVPTQVAVGEGAEALEVVEQKPVGSPEQAGEDAEPGLLVDDPVESLVRVPARLTARVSGHGCAPVSSTTRPRRATGRVRTAPPWPTAREPARRGPRAT